MGDSELPLYMTLGGGLTELASAYLIEPRIADRLTATWIGGTEYPGNAVAPPRAEGPDESEYNTTTDIAAAQVVFDSAIPLGLDVRPMFEDMIAKLRRVAGQA